MEDISRAKAVDVFNRSRIPIFFDEDVTASFEAISNLLEHPALFEEAKKIRKEREERENGKDRK